MGAITPIGIGVGPFWDSLVAGRSGAGPVTLFDASQHRTRIAAEVSDYDPTEYFDTRELRRLDRYTQFFLVAVREALSQAGLSFEEDDPAAARAGVIAGAGFGGMQSFIDEIDTLRQRGPDRVSPTGIPKIIPNIAAGIASIEHHLLGPVTCVVTACSASANAIGDAAELIRRGAADVMVAGGAEAGITDYAMAGFAQARAMTTRNDEPERASRPFDKDRDGFLMGEGGGALVLESLEHAQARGAEILAEVTGYGMSADAYHITLPRPGGQGAARAMTLALQDARISPDEVSYINAHGTSTPAGDKGECDAVKAAFGDHAYKLAVSSTKSMTGHLLGAAGGVEAVFTVLAIRDQVAPPTINLENQDPECDLDFVPNEAREMKIDLALSNSFGFGGTNGTLAFRRLR